jgi:hypothetical protein
VENTPRVAVYAGEAKMIEKTKKLLCWGLVGSLAACSSTTVIRSTDSAAKIYVDGEFKGKGSVTHTDKKIVGSTTHVKLEKDGCEPQAFEFIRSEAFDPGACVGGIFVLFPFLWIMRYKAEHLYEYKCIPVKD